MGSFHSASPMSIVSHLVQKVINCTNFHTLFNGRKKYIFLQNTRPDLILGHDCEIILLSDA